MPRPGPAQPYKQGTDSRRLDQILSRPHLVLDSRPPDGERIKVRCLHPLLSRVASVLPRGATGPLPPLLPHWTWSPRGRGSCWRVPCWSVQPSSRVLCSGKTSLAGALVLLRPTAAPCRRRRDRGPPEGWCPSGGLDSGLGGSLDGRGFLIYPQSFSAPGPGVEAASEGPRSEPVLCLGLSVSPLGDRCVLLRPLPVVATPVGLPVHLFPRAGAEASRMPS